VSAPDDGPPAAETRGIPVMAFSTPADQKIGNVARVASLFEEELLIQIIGREPHATTGLDCRIGFKDKAIRERPDLPHHFSLPNI
jgi:hypothetical protein